MTNAEQNARAYAVMADHLYQLDRHVVLGLAPPARWAGLAAYQSAATQADRAEIARLEEALIRLEAHQIWMERTLSWRITAPLRWTRDRVRQAQAAMGASYAAIASSIWSK